MEVENYVEGCFKENYMKPHICPIATGGWCRDYIKCKSMEESIIRRQQLHNQKLSEDKNKPVKTVVLSALLVFIILCAVTTIFEIIRMIRYGVMEIQCVEVVILLVLYAVISIMAAGLLYYITQREDK